MFYGITSMIASESLECVGGASPAEEKAIIGTMCYIRLHYTCAWSSPKWNWKLRRCGEEMFRTGHDALIMNALHPVQHSASFVRIRRWWLDNVIFKRKLSVFRKEWYDCFTKKKFYTALEGFVCGEKTEVERDVPARCLVHFLSFQTSGSVGNSWQDLY